MRQLRPMIAALALLTLPACVTGEMLYADRYSFSRVQAIPVGTTLQEVSRQLGAHDFKSGFKYTWIQSTRQSTGLRVTEVSMYFTSSGVMTGHADYQRKYY